MAIILNGTTGIDMGNTPVSNIVNGDNNDAVNKDYAVGKVTSTDNAVVRFNGVTGEVQNSGVIIDDSGNVGIGATPSAIGAGYAALQIKNCVNIVGVSGVDRHELTNAHFDGTAWRRINATQKPTRFTAYDGNYTWGTAVAGAAGSAITFSDAMTLDSSGNLIVGGTSASTHTIQKATVEDGAILYLYGGNSTYSAVFTRADGIGHGSSSTALRLQKNLSTNRSINAAGTINASGADYAEYEYSNDITLVKGQIVGFKADGTLTDSYNESIRFAIKSTNPSIVGGDTWGIEEIVGKRPEKPVKSEEMTEEEFAELEELYELELADFEARLEVERQKVDRIAYAGKVPVNVYGAKAGQYIIAIEKDGGIDGLAVNKADMTFTQYQDAVGRVNKILYDGRAEVAVLIH